MATIIQDEEAAKQRLAESLKKIRRAEGYPAKDHELSFGRKRQNWFRSIKTGNAAPVEKESK